VLWIVPVLAMQKSKSMTRSHCSHAILSRILKRGGKAIATQVQAHV
jgi:hypothetical protein